MEQKLKYKKRKIILTLEEQQEIAKRIVEFMRECLIVDDRVSETEGEYKRKFKNFHYYFKEAEGKFRDSYYSRIYEKDGKFELTDENFFNHFEEIGGMFERFKYHIRMNGSLIHIKKLIEILGEKVSIYYLEDWAKRNVAIGLILNKIVQDLKQSKEGIARSEEEQARNSSQP